MVEIIRLHGDPHLRTQQQLPWYVTGALKAQELAEVEAHLSECPVCRKEFELELGLARQIRTLPHDIERGWATLKTRLEAPSSAPRAATLSGRRVGLQRAVVVQAATLALLVPMMTYAWARARSRRRPRDRSVAWDNGGAGARTLFGQVGPNSI